MSVVSETERLKLEIDTLDDIVQRKYAEIAKLKKKVRRLRGELEYIAHYSEDSETTVYARHALDEQ